MSMFDGLSGRLVAKAMERMNADAEREAVARLAPKPTDRVLTVGFGPGIGLECLLKLPVGEVVGVDPSAVMNKMARARNHQAVKDGRLTLVQTEVASLDPAMGSFDGAIAVHTLQMCRPFDPTAFRLFAALKPGGRLLSITHAWAAEMDFGSTQAFTKTLTDGLQSAGFAKINSGKANADKGMAVLIEAVR